MFNNARELVVIDNFYKAPEEIRKMALSLPYTSEEKYGHFERTPSFFPTNILDAFQDIIGEKILVDENWLYPRTSNGENLKTFNGSFYKLRNDTPAPNHIHHDCHDYTALIYLSPDCPKEYGTAFYEFTSTKSRSTTYPYAINGDEISRNYGDDISKWTCTDFVSNYYNRLVIFPSRRYHRACVANSQSFERICHLFLFNIDR